MPARKLAATPIGFTGTQLGMNEGQKQELRQLLLKRRGTFHHGDCVGADDEAAAIAASLGYTLVGHPSADPGKRAFNLQTHVWVLEALPPLLRNHQIVDSVKLLVAAPRTNQRLLRSGTWATVRYAEKQGVPVYILRR